MGRVFISDDDAPNFFGEDFRGVQSGSSSKDVTPPRGFLENLGEMATGESEGLPAQAKGALSGGAIGLTGALAGPALMAGAARVAVPLAGAAEGYRMGSKGSRAVGLPGAAGGVPGAIVGALAPGATTGAGIAEQIGGHFGGEGGSLSGLAAAILLKKYGGATLGKILAGKFGAQVLAEGMQAAKGIAPEAAPAILKGANPELLANIEKAILEGGASPATAKGVAAAEVAKGAASGAVAVSPALPGVANAVQTTVASKGPAQAIISFAKDVAKRNPKIGEKIWIELGPDGLPLRYLTPDQAGAAARAGKTTTWAKNLWQ